MVQILPAPDISGQLESLLFGPLRQGISSTVSGFQQGRQKEEQKSGIKTLAQQLGLSEEQAAELAKLDPQLGLKGLEIAQKDLTKKRQDALLNEFLGVKTAPQAGTVADSVTPTEITPEQGADTLFAPENLQPTSIKSLETIDDRDALRTEHQLNASRIIQSAEALGGQNAKFLLDLNQQLFESRDKELDNIEKERLKNISEANKRFAEATDKATDAALKAQDVKLSLEPVKEAIATGQSGPTARNVLAEAADALPDSGVMGSLKHVLRTPAQQVFKVGQGSFFKSLKESFGANVSTVETQMFMGSLFQFATDPDAQQFAVEYQDILADRTIAASEIRNSLLDADGVPVRNARQQFNQRMVAVLKEGEDRLRKTDWWRKTDLQKLQKQAISTEKKRDFLKKQIGPQ